MCKDHQLTLHTKWAWDGVSRQSQYVQSRAELEEGVYNENLFVTPAMPLKLVRHVDPEYRKIHDLLQPVITVFFSFPLKEIPEVVREELNRGESKIQHLRKTTIECNGQTIRINHILYFTMSAGKTA